MPLPEVHLIGGTRAEAVKFAPVITAIRKAGLLRPVLITDARAEARVDRELAAFGLAVDVTLRAGDGTDAELVGQLDRLWTGGPPAAVLVQGDTGTSLAGALAGCWHRIPVVHLDAGLRSGDLDSPFPREADRRLVAQIAALHLAPTPLAALNLLDEHIATRDVLITGNTAVDAALAIAGRRLPYENAAVAAARATGPNRLVVVAVQRDESSGEPLDRILGAVLELVAAYPDVTVILPAHPDPGIRRQVDAAVGGVKRIAVTGPLSYPDLSRLVADAYLVLTDSAGIRQQAPSFGVPVLMLRDDAGPGELLDAGGARLVGSDTARIVGAASLLLDSQLRRDAMTAGGNPYGDGLAGRRTAQAVAALLGLAARPAPMPARAISHTFTFGANA